MKKSDNGKTISWFSYANVDGQCNVAGVIYHYAAIGGYDRGGQTVYIITQSGNWTVPRTGKYMIELYGGEGGGITSDSGARFQYTTGGSSCQHYDSINLTAGTTISVTIGTGGLVHSIWDTNPDTTSTGTSFGNYSVAGGGNASKNGDIGGSAAGELWQSWVSKCNGK